MKFKRGFLSVSYTAPLRDLRRRKRLPRALLSTHVTKPEDVRGKKLAILSSSSSRTEGKFKPLLCCNYTSGINFKRSINLSCRYCSNTTKKKLSNEQDKVLDLSIKNYYILVENEKLSLRRIHLPNQENTFDHTVIMFHGAIENSNIYFSRKGKGLAAFLARRGCNVFLLDHCGRGLSRPIISSSTEHGQNEMITRDIPASHLAVKQILKEEKRKSKIYFEQDNQTMTIKIDLSHIEKINNNLLQTRKERNGNGTSDAKNRKVQEEHPIHWIAHSWGGVLLSSALIRYPYFFLADNFGNVNSQIWIGTKRTISVSSFDKIIGIDLAWNCLFRWLAMPQLVGYLPSKQLKVGSENEPRNYVIEVSNWVKLKSLWKDIKDQYLYDPSIFSSQKILYPWTLSITGSKDSYLGNPIDVKRFIQEHGETIQEKFVYMIIGKTNGTMEKYKSTQNINADENTEKDKIYTEKIDLNFSRDYGHVDILTHRNAEKDHYPIILKWLKDKSVAPSPEAQIKAKI